MLLPSALPFDTCHQSQKGATSTAAVTSMHPPSSPGGFLSLSSCRALQAILGGRPASPCQPSLPPVCQRQTIDKSTMSAQCQRQRPPLRVITQNSKENQRTLSPLQVLETGANPLRTNKRSRSEFEEADENAPKSSDRCAPSHENAGICSPHRDSFSTPKRQRRVPLLMPLGLSAEDFAGLDAISELRQGSPPPPPPPQQPSKEIVQVQLPAETETSSGLADQKTWSVADDRILVSTVLDKLNLSCNDWNDCARRLGKEGDSLGKRWKALIGEDEVGLRRGSRGRSRPELSRCWAQTRNV